MSDMTIRFVKKSDAKDILNIYSYFILNTAVCFEENIPSLESFEQRILDITPSLPYLVLENKNMVVGYAYASDHRSRGAYRWVKEVSVYLAPEYRGKGLGTKLYNQLFTILKWQGVKNILAGITIPNDKSINIHKRYGFELIGTYKNVGFKMGQWHDVSWYSLLLDKSDSEPLGELKNYRDHDWLKAIPNNR